MAANIETYISFQEYLESQPGSVVLFTLHNFRGIEIDRQLVSLSDIIITRRNTSKVKFTVDETLAAKLTPGTYKLYLYIGLPTAIALSEKRKLTAKDYTLNKCLTEQGITIRIRGGIQGTTAEGGQV